MGVDEQQIKQGLLAVQAEVAGGEHLPALAGRGHLVKVLLGVMELHPVVPHRRELQAGAVALVRLAQQEKPVLLVQAAPEHLHQSLDLQ